MKRWPTYGGNILRKEIHFLDYIQIMKIYSYACNNLRRIERKIKLSLKNIRE
jgi:hypothetical protein